MGKIIDVSDAESRIISEIKKINRPDSHNFDKNFTLEESREKRRQGMGAEVAAARLHGWSEEHAYRDKTRESDACDIQFRSSSYADSWLWVRPKAGTGLDKDSQLFVLCRELHQWHYEFLGWEYCWQVRCFGTMSDVPPRCKSNNRPLVHWMHHSKLRPLIHPFYVDAVEDAKQYFRTIDFRRDK